MGIFLRKNKAKQVNHKAHFGKGFQDLENIDVFRCGKFECVNDSKCTNPPSLMPCFISKLAFPEKNCNAWSIWCRQDTPNKASIQNTCCLYSS